MDDYLDSSCPNFILSGDWSSLLVYCLRLGNTRAGNSGRFCRGKSATIESRYLTLWPIADEGGDFISRLCKSPETPTRMSSVLAADFFFFLISKSVLLSSCFCRLCVLHCLFSVLLLLLLLLFLLLLLLSIIIISSSSIVVVVIVVIIITVIIIFIIFFFIQSCIN